MSHGPSRVERSGYLSGINDKSEIVGSAWVVKETGATLVAERRVVERWDAIIGRRVHLHTERSWTSRCCRCRGRQRLEAGEGRVCALTGSHQSVFDVGGQVGGDVRSCETGSGWKRSDMRPFLPVPWRGNKLSAFLTSLPLNVLNILDSI